MCTLHEHKADVNDCLEKLIQVLEIRNFIGTLNPIEFTTSTSNGIKKLLRRQEATMLKASRALARARVCVCVCVCVCGST